MNRMIEYFETLDKKNFIMLIISVLIICFLIVYYLNGIFSKEKEIVIKKELALVKKIRETKILNYKILKIKRKNKILKTELNNLKNDLIFLLSEIESSDVLVIDTKKFLNILYKYIKEGKSVNASFSIKSKKSLKKYNIQIKGNFTPDKFFDFAYFIKTLESPKAIVTINSLSISKQKNILDYDINLSIWSYR